MAICFGRLAQSSESCAVARRRAPLRNGFRPMYTSPQRSELVPTGVRVLNLCSPLPARSARAHACAISLSTRVFGTELPGGECCPCGGDHLWFRCVTKDHGQTAPRRKKPQATSVQHCARIFRPLGRRQHPLRRPRRFSLHCVSTRERVLKQFGTQWEFTTPEATVAAAATVR